MVSLVLAPAAHRLSLSPSLLLLSSPCLHVIHAGLSGWKPLHVLGDPFPPPPSRASPPDSGWTAGSPPPCSQPASSRLAATPVSGTGTATVFRLCGAACAAGAGWALGCCVFFKQDSLGCVGCGTWNLVSLRPGGSRSRTRGGTCVPALRGGSLARGPPGPSPLVPLLLSAVLTPLPGVAVSPGGHVQSVGQVLPSPAWVPSVPVLSWATALG